MGEAAVTNFWPEGPRDWCPRMNRAFKDFDKICAVIPPELITAKLMFWSGGDAVATIAVKVGKKKPVLDQVWLRFDGRLVIGRLIMKLLQGQIEGFEYLAGRWPWPGEEGPSRSMLMEPMQ